MASICGTNSFKRHGFSLARAQTGMVVGCPCPLLSVEPTRGLVDEKLRIIVTNLNPQQEVTLHCLHHSEDKDMWDAFGHYVSDEHGSVTGNRFYQCLLINVRHLYNVHMVVTLNLQTYMHLILIRASCRTFGCQ